MVKEAGRRWASAQPELLDLEQVQPLLLEIACSGQSCPRLPFKWQQLVLQPLAAWRPVAQCLAQKSSGLYAAVDP